MSCDVGTLISDARCFQCLNKLELASVRILSLCSILGWPSGSGGALVVDGVETVISSGVHDYSSITVINGGTLRINGSGQWAMIGVKGNLTIDATSSLVYQGVDWYSNNSFSATSPDGLNLTYTTNNGAGSNGGMVFAGLEFDGDRPVGPYSGGLAFAGNGGGGASMFQNGGNASATAAGNGSTNQMSQSGGGGATSVGQDGSPGDDSSATTPQFAVGCGGGGGFRGGAGGGIYLKVLGQFSNSGSISVAGLDGGIGGKGGDGSDDPGAFGGGAGGCGGGGGGGKVVIRYGTAVGNPSLNINFSGGFGGSGAECGVARHFNGTPADPDPQNPDPPRYYMNGEETFSGGDGGAGSKDVQAL